MSQNEKGMLFPFRLSASRMRQSAALLRRQGQTLDALALVRRAAEQDDTPAAWQALATELRLTGNWEAAAQVLARVLASDAHQPGVWMEMSRCLQALERPGLALDCAYHQLQEDPWSLDGDAARGMIAELEPEEEQREPRRTQRLIHRGLTAWQSGNRSLGERRIRRVLRIVREKERLLVTTAMMCMLEMDVQGALRYLPWALRLNPRDPRTLTALATVLQQVGKRRISRAFLRQAMPFAVTVTTEDSVLTAAWAQDAWQETADYLNTRMKTWPHRAALLSAKATMYAETGEDEAALDLWREILVIDPDDRRIAALRAAHHEDPENLLHVPGLIPRGVRRHQQLEWQRAAESLSLQELLRPGSRTRRLTDWLLHSDDPSENQLVRACLSRSNDDGALFPYLKELLCRPFLRTETRQWALITLAERGFREELLLMSGESYNIVQCQPVSEKKQQQPWRSFLPTLLKETKRYQQSSEIAEFAASLWRCMTADQRMEAVGSGRYVWCKALEILYLRLSGNEAQAARAAMDSPLSARRISRVLRRIARLMMTDESTQ